MEVEAATEHSAEHRLGHFGEEVWVHDKPALQVRGNEEYEMDVVANCKPGVIDDERDLAVADVPAGVGHGGGCGRRSGPVLRDGALRGWLGAQLVVIVGLPQEGPVGGRRLLVGVVLVRAAQHTRVAAAVLQNAPARGAGPTQTRQVISEC